MRDLSNENIIHIKKQGVEYIQFRKLLEHEDILTHCFTLKNLDFKSNDKMEVEKEECVQAYDEISNTLKMNYDHIIRPYQTHTDNVKIVKDVPEEIQIFTDEYKDIDGLVTNTRNVILSLGYADCIPLYFFDPVKKVIANIHSGWKGTLQRIGEKAVKKMINEYNCNPKDIICCIGPSIGKCHFEVEEDVYKMFHKEFSNIENRVIEKRKNEDGNEKYYIDTVEINKIILEKIGLEKRNIISSDICSVCNSDIIHSYRADKEKSGRNTAIIMLK